MFYIFILLGTFGSFYIFNNPVLATEKQLRDDTEFTCRIFFGSYVITMMAIIFEWFSGWQKIALIFMACLSILVILMDTYEKRNFYEFFIAIVSFIAPFVAWYLQEMYLFLQEIYLFFIETYLFFSGLDYGNLFNGLLFSVAITSIFWFIFLVIEENTVAISIMKGSGELIKRCIYVAVGIYIFFLLIAKNHG